MPKILLALSFALALASQALAQTSLLPPLPLSAAHVKSAKSPVDCTVPQGPTGQASMWMSAPDCKSWSAQAQILANQASAQNNASAPPDPSQCYANYLAGLANTQLVSEQLAEGNASVTPGTSAQSYIQQVYAQYAACIKPVPASTGAPPNPPAAP